MRHLLIALAGALLFASYLHGSARSSEVVDWGFEAAGGGWTATGATFDTSAPPHDGVAAARLIANSAAIRLESAYWLFPTVPGTEISATLWVFGASSDVSSISAELQLLGSDGRTLFGVSPQRP